MRLDISKQELRCAFTGWLCLNLAIGCAVMAFMIADHLISVSGADVGASSIYWEKQTAGVEDCK